jgi:transcriptional regulator with XRE-family HTH domain
MATISNTAGLGQQIREAREAAQMSQGELASAANLDQPHVSRIEHELTQPDVSTICRLADALAADWSYDGRRIVFRRRRA